MKPKIDFAFKEIMMDDRARTGFLAAVLKVRLQDIRETVILNTGLRREHFDHKLQNSSDIERWAKFINAERKEAFDILANLNTNIASAYHTFQAISQDKAKHMEYETHKKPYSSTSNLSPSQQEPCIVISIS